EKRNDLAAAARTPGRTYERQHRSRLSFIGLRKKDRNSNQLRISEMLSASPRIRHHIRSHPCCRGLRRQVRQPSSSDRDKWHIAAPREGRSLLHIALRRR